MPPSLILPDKDRAHMELGIRSKPPLRIRTTREADEGSGHLPSRATISVRRVCDSRRYGLGTVTETTERKSTPRTLAPAAEGGRNRVCPIEQWFLAVYTIIFQVEPLTEEQHVMVRTSLPAKSVLKICSVNPSLPWFKLPL